MRTSTMVIILWGLFVSSSAYPQGYPPLPPGGYYVACPYGLAPNFFRGYGGLPYMGYEFDSEWRSNRSDFPLPSLNWYAPVGSTDVVSRDGRAVWRDAQVRVACWILNELDYVFRHYDPIDYRGTVRPCGATRSGNTLTDTEFDPYDPGSSDEECSDAMQGGGGGSGIQYQPGDYTHGETVDWSTGIGNGGYSECGEAARVEFICIDIWNDVDQKWYTFACGYATSC